MSAFTPTYKAEGYNPGDNAGPFFVPREAAINDSRAMRLRAQLAAEKDPAKRKQLEMQIAVEEKYAADAQKAQQVVQDSVMKEGFTPAMQNDPMAMMRRKLMMQEAENRRASALGQAPSLLGHL